MIYSDHFILTSMVFDIVAEVLTKKFFLCWFNELLFVNLDRYINFVIPNTFATGREFPFSIFAGNLVKRTAGMNYTLALPLCASLLFFCFIYVYWK